MEQDQQALVRRAESLAREAEAALSRGNGVARAVPLYTGAIDALMAALQSALNPYCTFPIFVRAHSRTLTYAHVRTRTPTYEPLRNLALMHPVHYSHASCHLLTLR